MDTDREPMLTEGELRAWQDEAFAALQQLWAFTDGTGVGLEFTTGPTPIPRTTPPRPISSAAPDVRDVGHAGPGVTVDVLLDRARAMLDNNSDNR